MLFFHFSLSLFFLFFPHLLAVGGRERDRHTQTLTLSQLDLSFSQLGLSHALEMKTSGESSSDFSQPNCCRLYTPLHALNKRVSV